LIFTIQRFLEDHFSRRGLVDADQYAVRLANLYGQRRADESKAAFQKSMHKVSTVFFRGNTITDRPAFELSLLEVLDKKFVKKKSDSLSSSFAGGLATERKRVARSRLSARVLLESFKRVVERRAIKAFWRSRTKGKLTAHPETVGQTLLDVFLEGVLRDRAGHVLSEMESGVGWVDITLILSSVAHLMELKILRGSGTPGVEQLGAYMGTEARDEGWLVLFDTRNPTSRRASIPATITVPTGTVRVVVIDVNPIPPSRR